MNSENCLVVSDTSPLISLAKVGFLDLLYKLYSKVYIPREVANELYRKPEYKNEADLITSSSFIIIKDVKNRTAVLNLQKSALLDLGECEVIVLASELNANTVLVDEQDAREEASKMFTTIGAVGIIAKSYKNNLITKDDCIFIADKWDKLNRHYAKNLLDILRNIDMYAK